jgi:hypothetical protein
MNNNWGNSGVERRWGGIQTYNQQATRREPFGNLGSKDVKIIKLILKGTGRDDRKQIHLAQDKRPMAS